MSLSYLETLTPKSSSSIPKNTRAENWWQTVKDLPTCQLWRPDTELSYPVPDHGRLHFFQYQQMDQRYYPVSRLTTLTPEIKVIDYFPGGADLFPGIEQTDIHGFGRVKFDLTFRHQLFWELTLLISRYDHKLASSSGLYFQQAFDHLVPMELKPYYRELNPNFFDWLRDESC